MNPRADGCKKFSEFFLATEWACKRAYALGPVSKIFYLRMQNDWRWKSAQLIQGPIVVDLLASEASFGGAIFAKKSNIKLVDCDLNLGRRVAISSHGFLVFSIVSHNSARCWVVDCDHIIRLDKSSLR